MRPKSSVPVPSLLLIILPEDASIFILAFLLCLYPVWLILSCFPFAATDNFFSNLLLTVVS